MSAICIERRRFLVASASTGLLLAMGHSPTSAGAADPAAGSSKQSLEAINAWVRIAPDNAVFIYLSQAEIGQGISTTLPAILADELDARWSDVRVENAPVAQAYRNPRVGVMFTGNSESIQAYAELMRTMGASARQMLVSAAATRWNVPEGQCNAADGVVFDTKKPSRRATYGELAREAARRPVPLQPRLKDPARFKLMGRSVPRIDVPAKTDGTARFGIDVVVPGMAYAAIRHVHAFDGVVERMDERDALKMPGVIGVVKLSNAVAVVAEKYWQAVQALDRVKVEERAGANSNLSTESLTRLYRAAMEDADYSVVTNHGAPLDSIASGLPTLTQEFESQFLTHAPMEPMNATASVTEGGCEIWAPIQSPDIARAVVSRVLGIPRDSVKVNWTLSGGGFGRRVIADYVGEAAAISAAVKRPVKLIWSREEDMGHGKYRPATLTRMTAAFDKSGKMVALATRHVAPNQLQAVIPEKLQRNVDPHATEGLDETRYAIAEVHAIQNIRLDYHMLPVGVPTSVLRTTGFGPCIFALETMVDECAIRAGTDPYEYRRAMLVLDKRALAVLDLAAEKANWKQPLPAGRGRGIAFCFAFGTLLVQVVELSVEKDKSIRLHKVVIAADPGTLYDPGIARANLEGGAVWGLSCALKSEITFANGGTVQTNYHDYDVLRLDETPEIETHLIAGGGDGVGGMGEVGPVATPPALANAIFAATGVRVRSLPLSKHGYTVAASRS